MTTAIIMMTLIMVVRLGLPAQQPSINRLSWLSVLLILVVMACVKLNSGAIILMALLVTIHVIAERYFPDLWREPLRVVTLIDTLILIIVVILIPWIHIEPQTWLLSISSLGLKYWVLFMGALILGKEAHWLQMALMKGQQIKVKSNLFSSISERGLMYSGLVVGLPYWWLLGVLVAKGVFLKSKSEVGLVWANSTGSALFTLMVFDLIHRGLSG